MPGKAGAGVQAQPGLRIILPAIAGVYISQTLVGAIASQSLPALLREAGYPLRLIGLSSLFMLPWMLKFLWAAPLERWRLPPDGRRRSRRIILQGQLALAGVLAAAAVLPGGEMVLFAALLLSALLAASIDIACDGMAVDLLRGNLRGWGNSAQVGGGYVGVVLGGGAFLFTARHWGWRGALLAASVCLLVLTLPLLRLREPQAAPPGADADARAGHAMQQHRPSLRHAWARGQMRLGLLLAVVLGAGMRTASGLTAPLLIDHGLSLAQAGAALGTLSMTAGLGGTVLGGALVRWLGSWRATTLVVACQALVLAALAWLLGTGGTMPGLGVALALQVTTMSAGFVTIYSAFMQLSSPRQAGVDFTLFQCADALIAMSGGMFGAWLADVAGYATCLAVSAGMAALAAGSFWCLRQRTALRQMLE